LNAIITLIAPKDSLTPGILEQITEGQIAWFNRKVQDFDLQGKSIVFDFTNSEELAQQARGLGVLYHSPTSVPSYASLTSVAVGNLNISISTNGKAPLLEKSMANYVSSLIPPFFQLAVKKMHQLDQKLVGDGKHEFLAYIADTWYLNTISRLTEEQIDSLSYLFETGVLHPTTDLLGKVDKDLKITSRSPSSASLSSDGQNTLASPADPVEETFVKPVSILDSVKKIKTSNPVVKKSYNKIVDGATAVSHVAYQLSDIAFLYPLFKDKFVGQSMVHWNHAKVANLKGFPTRVLNQVTDHGAGETVRGALRNGSETTVVMDSAAISAVLPAMYNIVRDGLHPVFHVATSNVDENLVLESSYADVHKAIHTGFIILASSSVQQAHDMAIAAHIVARELKKPVLHFFDGVKVANQKSSIFLAEKDQFEKLGHIRATLGRKQCENLHDILSQVSRVLGRDVHAFDYTGAGNASVVLVSMGATSSIIKRSVEQFMLQKEPIGFVQVGVYKPWSAEKFLSTLPTSVKRVVVIDNETESGVSPLGLEVDSSFYGNGWAFTVPNVFTVSFERGLHNLHPKAVHDFIHHHLHGKTPSKIQWTPSADVHSFSNAATVEAVFWDKAVDQTAQAVEHFVHDTQQSTNAHVQAYTQHLSTSLDPIIVSHVRYSHSGIEQEHLVDHAKVIMVNDVSAVHHFNFVGAAQKGGSVFFNTPLAKQELLEALPAAVRHQLVKKQVNLYSVDATLISQNYTIFYGEQKEYLGDIVTAIFYKLAFTEDESQQLLNALFHRIENVHSDINVVYTKKEAIFTALKSLKALGVVHFAIDHHSTENELPVYLNGTVPSKVVFDSASLEPSTDVILRVTEKHHALLPVIFPSAFKLSHKLRPDVEGAYQVKVTENIRLTPSAYDRNVFHMELDITGTGLKYDIGDALGVYAQNDLTEVHAFLRMYGVDPSQIVFIDRPDEQGKVKSEVRTVEQLFVHNLDIFGKPGKKFYQYLAAKATNDDHKEEIAHLISDNDKFEQYVNDFTPTFADLLRKFHSARPSIEELIRVIPSMKPRHYSIASSQKMHPNSVHLLIVVVDWVSKDGVQRYGQATRFLVSAKIGDTFTVSVKPSVMKLPPSLEAPVIMSGLGTGMAPFRAFIEERWYWKQQGKKVGPMVLYFGSRNRANEYLYGEELEAYHAEGILTHLRLAFSRDQPQKIYIQHKIQEDSTILFDMMVKDKGAFYLCGPTWPVPDVTDALLHAFTKSMNLEQAHEYLEQLKNDERFVLEVY
jgi:sulfite reductase (NADPH) flavoprotein alpha-component